VKIERMVS